MLFRKDKFSNENSKVTTLLDKAGTINLGHLNMHEAALGSTNDNPLHGRTYNPHKISFSLPGYVFTSPIAKIPGIFVW